MSKPPNTTIIFQGIPSETSNWLVGIDTKFFNINQALKGIKNVPSGLHFIHYSLPTISSTNNLEVTQTSLRYGSWIECKNHDVIFFVWDAKIEKFQIIDEFNSFESLNYAKYLSNLGDIYNFTINYPENKEIWDNLTSYLDMELIQEFLPFISNKFTDEVNTVTPSKEENMILLDQLQTKDTSKYYEDPKQEEFKYTILQFKLNKPKSNGGEDVQEISSNYLDKSWYLEQLYHNDYELLLGELQTSFLMFIVIGNFCSGLQWVKLLKLISMSKSFIHQNKNFNLNFLKIFHQQLENLPCEYIEDTTSLNTAVDTKNFISILENFVNDIYPPSTWNETCCSKMKVNGLINDQWHAIKQLIQNKFNIDLDKLYCNTDDDNFEVFNLNDYDENDEDSPALA